MYAHTRRGAEPVHRLQVASRVTSASASPSWEVFHIMSTAAPVGHDFGAHTFFIFYFVEFLIRVATLV